MSRPGVRPQPEDLQARDVTGLNATQIHVHFTRYISDGG